MPQRRVGSLRPASDPASIAGVDPDQLLPFIVIGIFIAMLAVVFIAAKKQGQKAHENLSKLAQRLRLTPPPPMKSSLLQAHRLSLSGTFRGRPLRVFPYSTGSGKSRRQWCAIAAGVQNPAGLELRISKENLFTKVGRKLGLDDVSVGDAAFDQEFYLKSNKPAFVSAALIPEIRERITDLWKRQPAGSVEVDGTEVKYAESGTFANDAICERLVLAAELVCDLGEVADACAE